MSQTSGDSETPTTPMPARRHRSPLPGESLTDWRVGILEEQHEQFNRKFDQFDRKLDKIIANQAKRDESNAAAIERCSRHEDDIKTIRREDIPVIHKRIDRIGAVPRARGDRVSFWTSIGALIAAAAAGFMSWLTHTPPPSN